MQWVARSPAPVLTRHCHRDLARLETNCASPSESTQMKTSRSASRPGTLWAAAITGCIALEMRTPYSASIAATIAFGLWHPKSHGG